MMRSIYFVWLFFISSNLSAQLFQEQSVISDSYPIRKISSESFKLDEQGKAHIIIYSPTDTSNTIFYTNNCDEGQFLGHLFSIKHETIEAYQAIFYHFLSIEIDSEGVVYVFFIKEFVKHDDDLNILTRKDQIICNTLKNTTITEEVIYETTGYILNSKYTLDSNDKIHISFIVQTDSSDPESPKIIKYINNVSGVFDKVRDVSKELNDTNLHHFQFLLDPYDKVHFFTTAFEGEPLKNYLNYWYQEDLSFKNMKIDSVKESAMNPWFDGLNSTIDNSGKINLLYYIDSLYHLTLNASNKNINISSLTELNSAPYLFINDYEIGDSASIIQIYSQDQISKFYLWDSLNADQPLTFEIDFYPIGFEIDLNGYFNGFGLRNKVNQNFFDLIFVKSAIPFDPLPKLPPDSPDIEDTVFCFENEKKVIYDGVEIKWYQNDLNHLIGVGDTIYFEDLHPGLNLLFATETIFESTSDPDSFFINVNTPELYIGEDTTIHFQDSLIIQVDKQFVSYDWSLGSDSSSALVVGANTGPGNYQVTLFVENEFGCMASDTLMLMIDKPFGPKLSTYNFCADDEKIIEYSGDSVIWYFDNIGNEIARGDTLELKDWPSGHYRFLVTHLVNNFRSSPGEFYVNVNLPEVNLGSDLSLASDDSVLISVGNGFSDPKWSTGSDSSSVLIAGKNHTGEITLSVEARNMHGCLSIDSITISIEQPLALEKVLEEKLKIFPNPTKGIINIEFLNSGFSDQAEVSIYNMQGKCLMKAYAGDLPCIYLTPYKSEFLILKYVDKGLEISRKIFVE